MESADPDQFTGGLSSGSMTIDPRTTSRAVQITGSRVIQLITNHLHAMGDNR